MRCDNCNMIPIIEFNSPVDYLAALEAFDKMVKHGTMEIAYQNMPIDIMLAGGINLKEKFFHQFRCPECGTIYGMFVNMRAGGQIKIDERVFDPADYPDPPEKKEES